MDPSKTEPSPEATPDCPSAHGELVVQSGRLSGARRPLKDALTLLGRAEHCDVRLNADGVSPVHCALVRTPAGVMARDLGSDTGTLVNGEPAGPNPLRDGDLLAVGPFRFRVALAPPFDAAPGPEALRVQAAAVAAQQAALLEEEGKLEQRRVALQRQEEQLAGHLEERRRQLLDLQGQVKDERAALRRERADLEQQSGQARQEIDGARQLLAVEQEQVQALRRRLGLLPRRLRRRWQRLGQAAEARVRQREAALTVQARALEREQERLRRDRQTWDRFRLRANGDVELRRRQVQDGWEQLRAEEARHAERRADLDRRAAGLDRRAAALEQAERDLERRQRDNAMCLQDLEREAEGLEERVRHHRRKLLEQQQESVRLDAVLRELQGRVEHASSPGAAVPAVVVPGPAAERPTAAVLVERPGAEERRRALLERLAGNLADQRLHLAEHCAYLLEAQERWNEERAAIAAEMEEVARRLQERERELRERERAWLPLDLALRRRQEEARRQQLRLEGWQARLAAREVGWEVERDRLLAKVRAREERAERQAAALELLRQRWLLRRRREMHRLRAELERGRELHARYAALEQEGRQRNARLEQQERRLAERALALERYRLEFLGKAPNAGAAERRLERLRRRHAATFQAAARRLEQQRQAQDAEAARLQKRFQELQQFHAAGAAEQAEASARQSTWEDGQRRAEQADAQLVRELRTLHGERKLYARQLAALHAELERVVQHLLDEPARPPAAAVQAA